MRQAQTKENSRLLYGNRKCLHPEGALNAPVLCTLYRLGKGQAGILAEKYMTEGERRARIARLRGYGLYDVLWLPASSLKTLLEVHDEKA